ncbi:MAG TPA: DegQ family serine endoprotease [Bryobacteraceae bacterium]|jgi:serine protease Do|nr:DegQ family serine endoprotease [Bryobacteraceae bacterium]
MNRIAFGRARVAAALAVALGLVLGGMGVAHAQKGSQNPPATFKFTDAKVTRSRSGFAPVVKAVVPTVVSIKSSKVVKTGALRRQRGQQDQGQIPDQLRQFFGDQFGGQFNIPNMPEEQRSEGLGSGVIVSPEGYILTNNHVVDGATDVQVMLSDRREYKARVIGKDDKADIAVVKIDAGNLPAITIGNSDAVEVGDYALAVGNPFGVGQTVTLGIVSATHRGLGNEIEAYEDFIQTDAAINPGNSGGALVNDRGELIGINTAIIAHGSEGNQGIGFAVPVNLARNIMNQILKNGKVTRARLGILPQDVTPTIARQFGVKDSQGALVGEVEANSPAQKAGLKTGDIILDVDDHSVYDANQLRNMISSMQPNTNVNLKIWRDGASHTLPVTLGELNPEEASNRGGGGSNSGVENALDGVSVENLTPQIARQLKLPASAAGVVVNEVRPASAAASAGLQQGDVIQEVNRRPVKNVAEFEAAVRNSKDGTLLLVNRDGHTVFVGV